MKASISIETLLVFTGMILFWTILFSAIAPQLDKAKQKAQEAQLQAECEKLASLIDTLSTYGKGIELSYTRFIKEKNKDLYFCQDTGPCQSNIITIIKRTEEETTRAQCKTRIAEWVNIKSEGKILSCKQAIDKDIRAVEITYATYVEKENRPRGCE